MYGLNVKVDKTGAIERYDVDLQSVDEHVATPYDPSSLARVLDVVFPPDQKAYLDTGSLVLRNSPNHNVEVREARPSGSSKPLIRPQLVVCCSPLCSLLDASLQPSLK